MLLPRTLHGSLAMNALQAISLSVISQFDGPPIKIGDGR
jgi:hypothetical protein